MATLVNRRNKIHPWKFALWLSCASITMLFAAWTSAYMVRQAAGNWLEFKLPSLFFASTAAIVLSSVTLHLSYVNFTKGNERMYKVLLLTTTVLGMAFVAFQYLGWNQMQSIGVPLTKNPSGDFLYVLSGVHALHVLGGIAILFVALFHAFSLKFAPTEKRKLRFELTYTYWHFVDFLWIYLLLFVISQS